MDAKSSWKWVAALALPCAVVAITLCGPVHGNAPVDSRFAQEFIELNRGLDDDATSVAYDPQSKILAVGRESGRLEIWNTRKRDSRLARQAHANRIGHIAIGPEDGIVLTTSAGTTMWNLDPQASPKVWDARSGELLAALPGDWVGGPVVASPIKGYYVIASADELRLYDHARRAVVGNSIRFKGEVTALGADRKSGLIAAGSSRGELKLLKLDDGGVFPQLHVVGGAVTYELESRTDVLAVMLRNQGKQLVTVNWLPKRMRGDKAPNIAGQQAEVVQWDTRTWRRERSYPFTLQAVHWASYTPGEPWLVLAGNESRRGRVELIDLQGGIAWRYKANTTHPVAVLLPDIRTGLILQSGRATRIRYLDQE